MVDCLVSFFFLSSMLSVRFFLSFLLIFHLSIKHPGHPKFRSLSKNVPEPVFPPAAASQVLLGSSVLIRNTVGIGGVLVLAAVSLLPLLKLLILYLGCQGSAALLQPVSDSRVVEAVGAVAKGFYFLLAAAGSAVVLFALSIAVVCASTNAAYFAG